MVHLYAKKGIATGEELAIDIHDDLSRNVFGILGIPIDAIGMSELVHKIETAALGRAPFLISTPNLNFVVQSLSDQEFRDSLLRSNVCVADGAPIVWAASMMGIPINERVAGSDIFDALKALPQRITGFLFGGQPGVAAAAAQSLNSHHRGMLCVGSLYPGFGSIEEMSDERTISQINASNAQFLVASLGAAKGQAWLLRNHDRLTAPVRSHLGAAINFQGGTLKRAPVAVRRSGLEWLWRIKEEPKLWTRYFNDGCVFLSLLAFSVLPYALANRWRLRSGASKSGSLRATIVDEPGSACVHLSGCATIDNVREAISSFRIALSRRKDVRLDLSAVTRIDPRFIGLCLMLRKQLREQGRDLYFTGVRFQVRLFLQVHRFGFLLKEA
jgi:N-acetylglucosaminyldiphosphoundecaprenol N-acetyl-beta-D-mannosaminyltransferase